jgi:anti-anti-sigma regulatory factor
MRYQISQEKGRLLIKLCGNTRKNEALSARKRLSRYLAERGMRVIVDLEELNQWEPWTLVDILNGIRKEVRLLNGDLKLRSLKPDIRNYFEVHRLDRIFQFCANEEVKAAGQKEKDHGQQ